MNDEKLELKETMYLIPYRLFISNKATGDYLQKCVPKLFFSYISKSPFQVSNTEYVWVDVILHCPFQDILDSISKNKKLLNKLQKQYGNQLKYVKAKELLQELNPELSYEEPQKENEWQKVDDFPFTIRDDIKEEFFNNVEIYKKINKPKVVKKERSIICDEYMEEYYIEHKYNKSVDMLSPFEKSLYASSLCTSSIDEIYGCIQGIAKKISEKEDNKVIDINRKKNK